MKVSDMLEHFLSRSDWVDRATTVDRIIAGDPGLDVNRCMVTWMPSMSALNQVVDSGVSLLVCHEPTFWSHHDDRPSDDPLSREKQKFIDDHGLVILRNHDCWDRWPGIGIPWAWAQFLGMAGEPKTIGANGYQHRYDIEPETLESFARRVAQRCDSIGESMVQVTGELTRQVSKIGTGTGCGCDVRAYREMGCDCSVVCDDGSCYWAGIQWAADFGHPVIRVNHGTSEEPGMVTLTEYINKNLKGVRARLIPHGSTFRLVGGAAPSARKGRPRKSCSPAAG